MAAPQLSNGSPAVVMMTGKQGRHDLKTPFANLLEVEETLRPEFDSMSDDDIDRIVNKVRDVVMRNQGHRFDAEHMEECGGAYAISCVAIDEDYNVTPFTGDLYRPKSAGGHVLFRNREHIKEIVEFTYPSLKPNEADSMEIKLVMAASANTDTVIMGPESLARHPKLLRAMGLRTLTGNPEDDVVAFYVRLCDGKGLGKSAPRLCNGKFKFLFPGVAIDTSQVKSRKRARAESAPPPAPVPAEPVDVKTELKAIVKRECMMSGAGRSILHSMAYKFLITLGEVMDDDAAFNAKMGAYLNIDPSVLIGLFGTVHTCQAVAKAAIDDADKVTGVMNTIKGHRAFLCEEAQ